MIKPGIHVIIETIADPDAFRLFSALLATIVLSDVKYKVSESVA